MFILLSCLLHLLVMFNVDMSLSSSLFIFSWWTIFRQHKFPLGMISNHYIGFSMLILVGKLHIFFSAYGSNEALFVPLHLQPCSNMFHFHFSYLDWCFLLSLISWIKCPKWHEIPLYLFEVYRVLYVFLLQGMQLPVAHLCTMPVCYTVTMIVVSCLGLRHRHSTAPALLLPTTT